MLVKIESPTSLVESVLAGIVARFAASTFLPMALRNRGLERSMALFAYDDTESVPIQRSALG